MAKIEINGVELEVASGKMLIEIADERGIAVPRFCYHRKLSIAASCRMCLVDVEKAPKPLPACATPVVDGMKIHTRSPKAIAAQRSVMEFLLINHPLDCPVCDQGGECDLQEISVGYGQNNSRYHEQKRVVVSEDIGPLIATEMTRCIHCTRCVRFGQEISGQMELGVPGRGEHMHIATFLKGGLTSELSGNVIDLCPVGALTSKPYRFTARPWELKSFPAVSPHDCVGANCTVQVRNNQVMRVIPRENDSVNEQWLADRDRFSYSALNHPDRLTTPMVKQDGKWVACDWDRALVAAADGLKRVVKSHGSDKLGSLASYGATNEEYYLLQKLMRGLGSGNIDHRLRQLDLSGQQQAPKFPALGQSIVDLEQADLTLLVGSNIRKEQPLLASRLRKAVRGGASLMALNSVDFELNIPLAESIVVAPQKMVNELAAIATALVERAAVESPEGLAKLLGQSRVEGRHRAIAEQLMNAEQPVVLAGSLCAYHPSQDALVQLSALLARLAGGRFGYLSEGGNSAGAWLAGCLPHRTAGGVESDISGLDWRAMNEQGMKGYLLMGVEPELDSIDPHATCRSVAGAEFVVSLTPYITDAMREYADVLLPVAQFTEMGGSYYNTEGRLQSSSAAVTPPGEARPAWKILRVLGNLFDIDGFEFFSHQEVAEELATHCGEVQSEFELPWQPPTAARSQRGLMRIADFPIYTVDPMVRRAAPLQATPDASTAVIRANLATLKQHGLEDQQNALLQQNGEELELPLLVDETIADNTLYLACGVEGSSTLGAGFSPVQLVKV